MSSFHEHDGSGQCAHHPEIRLRKKTTRGEWKVLLRNCPLCAMECMTIPQGCDNHDRINTSSYKSPTSCKIEPPPPNHIISKPNYQNRILPNHSDDSSTGTRSTCHITEAESFSSGSKSSSRSSAVSSLSSSSSSTGGGASQYSPPSRSSAVRGSKIVCGMRYTCPTTRQCGSYTGQIERETQLPQGLGTLRLRDRTVLEGEWVDGYLSSLESDCRGGGAEISNKQEIVMFAHPPSPIQSLGAHLQMYDDCDERTNSNNSFEDDRERSSDVSVASRSTYSAREVKSKLPTRSFNGGTRPRSSGSGASPRSSGGSVMGDPPGLIDCSSAPRVRKPASAPSRRRNYTESKQQQYSAPPIPDLRSTTNNLSRVRFYLDNH